MHELPRGIPDRILAGILVEFLKELVLFNSVDGGVPEESPGGTPEKIPAGTSKVIPGGNPGGTPV